MKPLIFVDMDNTINNIIKGFLNMLQIDFNIDYPKLKHEDLISFNLGYYAKLFYSEYIPEPGCGKDKFKNYTKLCLNSPRFFLNLPIKHYVKRELGNLSKVADVYLLTKPVKGNRKTILDKMAWADKYIPFIGGDKTLCVFDKSIVSESSILIDDDYRNLQTFKGKTIRMDYPYNRPYTYNNNIGVLYDWKDGCEKIMTMIDSIQ
jgi:5'(3')-deoxyribonucleotidase